MGACMSKAGVFLSPEITVVSAEVRSLSFSGVELECLVSARNPNPGAELKASRILYVLKKASDGTILSEGVSNKEFTLPPMTTIQVKLPMTFKYSALGAVGKSMYNRGKTKILVSGEITFDAPMTPSGTSTSKYAGEVEIVVEE